MTACAIETATGGGTRGHGGWSPAADGSYAARLVAGTAGPYVERWTLSGPEPYVVALPAARPEPADCQVLALADGRVLVARPEGAASTTPTAHRLALLYPTGPETGELPLGTVQSGTVTLLPAAPDGRSALLMTPNGRATRVWQVTGPGTEGGPRPVADVPGTCVSGHWLDREGRLLALNRRSGETPAKAVAVDLARGGTTSPLLQITEESQDEVVLADADSGLLLVRSDAPGETRLGWGVLGSHRPVRFPEALHMPEVRLEPFAVQPGQALVPEDAAVALRADGPNGTWVAWWRPGTRLRHLAAPRGWLPGAGLLGATGELRLPYEPCGLARAHPAVEPPPTAARTAATGAPPGARGGSGAAPATAARREAEPGPLATAPSPPRPRGDGPHADALDEALHTLDRTAAEGPSPGAEAGTGSSRPVPLQQAPLP
ncbi:hypothetical protein [Streptomyces alkaliterrae]|uniref:Uncharacterized protein n=1 Tax=Streptomyces alkaliterrae TaxID=2213162 RepID=A0A5P0YSR9_9ACTN|nr:hypothetical protein [Streptomyces alkaliterrae]MBB1257891.1 hypothetical protein [Streptomyces alkaliterrae]MQS02647.1 hypothetical protein [Streptomyces alkaliterrae]